MYIGVATSLEGHGKRNAYISPTILISIGSRASVLSYLGGCHFFKSFQSILRYRRTKSVSSGRWFGIKVLQPSIEYFEQETSLFTMIITLNSWVWDIFIGGKGSWNQLITWKLCRITYGDWLDHGWYKQVFSVYLRFVLVVKDDIWIAIFVLWIWCSRCTHLITWSK